MYEVKLDQAKSILPVLVRAAIEGERVFIFQDDRQVVQLVPVSPPKRRPQFGSAKGLVVMAKDFDAPLEDTL